MSAPTTAEYDSSVFINCPFDDQYKKLFHAVVFAVTDCGFIARCAQEVDDGSEVRVSKILKIIAECRIGIHDISRTEADKTSGLPRFNMPLELGMFLGAKQYGTGKQRKKICLVFDRERFRYQKFCSDISGQDIAAHEGKVETAVNTVRNFLGNMQKGVIIPGPAVIFRRYLTFTAGLPALCSKLRLRKPDLTFNDYSNLVAVWLKTHPRR